MTFDEFLSPSVYLPAAFAAEVCLFLPGDGIWSRISTQPRLSPRH